MTDDEVGGRLVTSFTQNTLGGNIGDPLVNLRVIKLNVRVKIKPGMRHNIFNIYTYYITLVSRSCKVFSNHDSILTGATYITPV